MSENQVYYNDCLEPLFEWLFLIESFEINEKGASKQGLSSSADRPGNRSRATFRFGVRL